jgi:hypothetical protein
LISFANIVIIIKLAQKKQKKMDLEAVFFDTIRPFYEKFITLQQISISFYYDTFYKKLCFWHLHSCTLLPDSHGPEPSHL